MKKLLGLLALSVSLFSCSTGGKSPEQLKTELTKEIPGITKIDSVNKTPVAGVYEVVVGRKIFYVSADGKYLFFGNIIDPRSKKSLTEERTSELSKIDVKLLPIDLAIKEVNGTGKRVLYVFSDSRCPYCQMFEKQIVPLLQDTTIYTFLFPLPMHPEAKTDSQKIWCSENRAKAWMDWMRNKVELPANTKCDTSGLDKVYKLGTDLIQVEGTPTLILSNGQIIPGALPADKLLQRMDEASGIKPVVTAAPAAPKAATPSK